MTYTHHLTRTPDPTTPPPATLVTVTTSPSERNPDGLVRVAVNTAVFGALGQNLTPAEAHELAAALVTAANDLAEHPDNAVPLVARSVDDPDLLREAVDVLEHMTYHGGQSTKPIAYGHLAPLLNLARRTLDDLVATPAGVREFPGFASRPDDVAETHDERLDRVVHEALGAASVAWTGTPRGIFDDTFARQVAAALLDEVHRYASSTAHRHAVARDALARIIDAELSTYHPVARPNVSPSGSLLSPLEPLTLAEGSDAPHRIAEKIAQHLDGHATPTENTEPTPPPMPTTPGFYLDRVGDPWRLDTGGRWRSLLLGALGSAERPEVVSPWAPFTPARLTTDDGTPGVPTAPGTYTDRDGDTLTIHDDGTYSRIVDMNLVDSHMQLTPMRRKLFAHHAPYTRTE